MRTHTVLLSAVALMGGCSMDQFRKDPVYGSKEALLFRIDLR